MNDTIFEVCAEFKITEPYLTEIMNIAVDREKKMNKSAKRLNVVHMIEKVTGRHIEYETLSKYICDFGTYHSLNDKCRCYEVYKCTGFQFQDKLKELGYIINYNTDITPTMKVKLKQLTL